MLITPLKCKGLNPTPTSSAAILCLVRCSLWCLTCPIQPKSYLGGELGLLHFSMWVLVGGCSRGVSATPGSLLHPGLICWRNREGLFLCYFNTQAKLYLHLSWSSACGWLCWLVKHSPVCGLVSLSCLDFYRRLSKLQPSPQVCQHLFMEFSWAAWSSNPAHLDLGGIRVPILLDLGWLSYIMDLCMK